MENDNIMEHWCQINDAMWQFIFDGQIAATLSISGHKAKLHVDMTYHDVKTSGTHEINETRVIEGQTLTGLLEKATAHILQEFRIAEEYIRYKPTDDILPLTIPVWYTICLDFSEQNPRFLTFRHVTDNGMIKHIGIRKTDTYYEAWTADQDGNHTGPWYVKTPRSDVLIRELKNWVDYNANSNYYMVKDS